MYFNDPILIEVFHLVIVRVQDCLVLIAHYNNTISFVLFVLGQELLSGAQPKDKFQQ